MYEDPVDLAGGAHHPVRSPARSPSVSDRSVAAQEVLKEITETDVVIRIKPLHKCRFAYALMSGGLSRLARSG